MRWSNFIPSRRWLIVPPIVIGAAVVAALAASRQELNRVEVQESALPVDFMTVTQTPIHPQIVAYGSAEPNRRWTAVAEVGGRVEETRGNLESGVPVREGELLVSIDRSDYQLRLEQREADLRQAESQLEQLKLNERSDTESLRIQKDLLRVRQHEVSRLENLQIRSAASESELDVVRAAMLQQQQSVQTLVNSLSTYGVQIDSAEAAIALSKSRVKEARRDLDRTQIRSPSGGLLFDVDLQQGQYVAPGQTLFEVIDTSWVEIEAQVSAAQWSRVLRSMQPGGFSPDAPDSIPVEAKSVTEMKMISTALPVGGAGNQGMPESKTGLSGLTAVVTVRSGEHQEQFVGTPVRLTSTLDQQTRTMGVVIRVDNPDVVPGRFDEPAPRLRPGSYCEIAIRSETAVLASRVPRSSIEDGSVWCIGNDDRLHRRAVDVAFTVGEDVAVIGGLWAGDRVVLDPPALAMEGQLAMPVTKRDDDGLPAAESAP